jgi:hypothetical protein
MLILNFFEAAGFNAQLCGCTGDWRLCLKAGDLAALDLSQKLQL